MSTRGILRPGGVGTFFFLERRAPPADLAALIDSHWLVRWDRRGQSVYESEVMPHPSVHLVIEPSGAAVYGVTRHRYVRRVEGAGWAVGTKFAPGGFAPFAGGPVGALTDRVLPAHDLLGAAAQQLSRRADTEARLHAVHDLLRSLLPPAPDPRIALVQAIVADIRTAPPDGNVPELAARHHISVRTLQRLFHRYVGVGPKWVMQRYRLHDAIERLDRRRRQDWTQFALDLGYYDQAHFLRDFRLLVGRSPAEYELETLSG
ncbi:MAG TPA: helix-turn-helix domain-containing protein [Solirubrobacteraceae bacterium]|nr:helix-turn-helix domain-containing protein [Solirubrobacteraceae bacterium]